jgi:ribonuclease-3
VARSSRSEERDEGLLAARIGYDFSDPELLSRAMAHRSWCAEHPGTLSNERLEFLGDAVLGWVVADLAFRRFTDLPEGDLTGVRKGVVNSLALAAVAEGLGLGQFLRLGRGEDAAGGREKPSILSDALEAVFGAVYIDGGPAVAYDVVERLIGPGLAVTAARLDHLDHKSRLQELAAMSGGAPPQYTTRAEGPDHAKRFFASVSVDGHVVGEGTGRSKKAAEQAAAEAGCTAWSAPAG